MLNESGLQGKIVRRINSIPECVAYPIVVSAGMQRGMPDVIACVRGRFVGIETKSPKGGNLTKIQEAQRQRISNAGSTVIVAKTADDAIKKVKRLSRLITNVG